jgi:DNA mismatch repair protein MutL
MTIRVLSEAVAAQIAAGEVIERPASVVKELIENSLDAGASTITIEIQEGGKRLIRVSDNGLGIPATEAELAFVRHATSKLSSVDDLNHLQTLGFRGEALASIAAVSQMRLLTRTHDESTGVEITVSGSQITGQRLIGAPQGTVISVENLFFNIPARLKFLKKETSERQHISALINHYAMAYPQVRFKLIHGNQTVLNTSGNGNLRDVLAEVLGIQVMLDMVEITPPPPSPHRPDLSPVQVGGFIGLPALNKSNRNQIVLFINGRWIQDSSLSYAVIQAYHTMLMVGRYPVAVVMVSLPPEEVDVNVHPTKAQVRFRQPDAVFGAVQRAVRETLIEQAPPPAIQTESAWGIAPEWLARRERLRQITSERVSQLGFGLDGDEDGDSPAQAGSTQNSESSASQRPTRSGLPMLRVIGQAGTTYVIAEGPAGLYLIDQHAAHERILFEQFMREKASAHIASQELLQALPLDLPVGMMGLIEENMEILTAVGFSVEIFGPQSVLMRAVPVLVMQADPAEALMAALGEIECGEMPLEATAEQKLIARVCKQAAIKAGQALSPEEMQALIRQLEQCESPRTCPHGRPTMLHLSAEELAKQFGRLGAI